MTRFRTVSGQMVGWPMPGIIETILALTISRMLRAGYAPWMYQLSWEETSKCTTWSISFEYMPNEGDQADAFRTLSSTAEYAHHYTVGDGVSTVAVILTGYTLT